MPHVRVPRHLAQLVARLVAPLVIDYFAYAADRVPRHVARLVAPLVVNFDYATRPGASTLRAARHAARR
jgi:hypothetical protein